MSARASRGGGLSMIPAFLALAACGMTLAGCEIESLWFYTCIPDPADIGPKGGPHPCDKPDASAEASGIEMCPYDDCVFEPDGWGGPWYFWQGPDGEQPECPYGGTDGIAWEGGKDLVPFDCPPCKCGRSVGSCGLSSKLTASTATCSQSGGVSIPFDAPMSWDGTCDNMNPIGPGKVQSLKVDPLPIQEEGCNPSPVVPRDLDLPHPWYTVARACHEKPLTCGDSHKSCLPSLPPFRKCITYLGDVACPKNWEMADRYVFYGDVEGGAQCSDCTCGPPKGSMCTASLSIYKSSDCSGQALFYNQISSANTPCYDLSPPGEPLGSKAMTPPTYLPGTCDPIGGLAIDNRTLSQPKTICCK